MKRDKKRPTTKTKTAGRPRTSNDSSAKFAQGEHVRIVPLHYPKPSVSIDELGRLRGETADTDLFDGQPHVAPASAHLMYNHGPLLTAVQVFTVFWGTKWSASGGSVMIQNLNKFFQALVVSPLVNQLQEYGVHGQNIGSGSFIGTKDFAEAGGVIGYGWDVSDNNRRAALFVVKILRGTKPADLLVEQPTKFELVINLKTAKALGLTIPQTLLLRADQVIQ